MQIAVPASPVDRESRRVRIGGGIREVQGRGSDPDDAAAIAILGFFDRLEHVRFSHQANDGVNAFLKEHFEDIRDPARGHGLADKAVLREAGMGIAQEPVRPNHHPGH